MAGVSKSCGACKFLRRKCKNEECVFRPYFSYDEANSHFGAIHKVFGASNVSRLLINLPEQFRGEASLSIAYQALARIRDPVYGCVSHIYALQQEVAILQEEIEVLGNNMGNVIITNDASSSQELPINNLQDYWIPNSTNNINEQELVTVNPVTLGSSWIVQCPYTNEYGSSF